MLGVNSSEIFFITPIASELEPQIYEKNGENTPEVDAGFAV